MPFASSRAAIVPTACQALCPGVDVDGGARERLELVDGEVHLADAGGLLLGRAAAVGGRQRDAVGLQDHRRPEEAEALCDAVDPRLVLARVRGAAGGVLRAVAA